MSERLRWNDDERKRLLDAALPHLLADARLSIVDAVRRVQDTVLPKERRRNLPNIGAIPVELRSALELRRKAASGAAELVPAGDLKAALERTAQLELDNKQLSATVQALREHVALLEMQPKPPEPLEVLQEFLAGVLRRARQPETMAAPRPQSPAKHDPQPQQAERRQLPAVLICGLKPQQRAFFESNLNGRVRLKWWMDENLAALKGKAREADMVYLMMGAVSHATVETVKSVTNNFQRVATHNPTEQLNMINSWLQRRETNG